MARDFTPGARVIAAAKEIIAVGEGREGAVERYNLEFGSANSRMTSGRSRLTTYEQTENRYPR
jgi:hypothetical protein